MDGKRLKCTGWAVDNCFVALYQIQHVHAAAGVVQNGFAKPVAAGFDKFTLVQASTLFTPAVSFRDRFELIHQMLMNPPRVALPVDHLFTVLQVYRARQPVQAQAAPVPQFEGENIRRSADLQHHGSRAGAVHRPSRDQEMIVLFLPGSD